MKGEVRGDDTIRLQPVRRAVSVYYSHSQTFDQISRDSFSFRRLQKKKHSPAQLERRRRNVSSFHNKTHL